MGVFGEGRREDKYLWADTHVKGFLRELGFEISATVRDGIDEIKKMIECGVISNPESSQYYNIPR